MSELSAIKKFDISTYETLVAYNGDILFEWDLVTDRFYTTSNLFDIFGYMPSSYDFTTTVEKSENIHPEDKLAIKRYLETIQFTSHDLKNGKHYAKLEIRIRNVYHKYIWCKIRLIAHYSKHNMPYKISGMITNIDFDKKHQAALVTQAQNDLLTGLYNKATSTRLMNDWISSAPPAHTGALILIDLDGFKSINDHFGHLFGDAVIADIASSIKEQFLESDIIGRIGGDEFTVFVKDVYSLTNLKQKLNSLNAALVRSYASDEITYTVSASIGIALYPAHGKDFKTLFANADQALYHIKRHGKNEFMLYRERLPKSTIKEKKLEEISSLSEKSFDENLLEYIFKILYNTRDSHAAIQLLLEVLGKKLKISRAFIYRQNADSKYYINEFEWCDTGIKPRGEKLKQLTTKEVDLFHQQFHNESQLICNDIKTLPSQQIPFLKGMDTKAFLYQRMIDNNVSTGFIVFDECRYNREWTTYEINILTFLSDVLISFLQRKHMMNKLEHSYAEFLNVFQTLDSCLYIVDRYTHDIIFANHKMNLLFVKNDTNSNKCYELMHQLDQPCEDCPMRNLSLQCRKDSSEAYDAKRKIWIKKTISKINWANNSDCCLVQVEDITAKKELEFMPMN